MTCGSLWPVGALSPSMTCPRLNGLFGKIYDMWFTVNLFYNRTKVWLVTGCEIVFYSYICMTHGSLWALGVHLKQYKIGLFFKTMSSSQGVQSGVQSPRKTSPVHVISPDFNTYKTPPPHNLTLLDWTPTIVVYFAKYMTCGWHCGLIQAYMRSFLAPFGTFWHFFMLHVVALFGTFWHSWVLQFWAICSSLKNFNIYSF